jgi:hypothetical protein
LRGFSNVIFAVLEFKNEVIHGVLKTTLIICEAIGCFVKSHLRPLHDTHSCNVLKGGGTQSEPVE